MSNQVSHYCSLCSSNGYPPNVFIWLLEKLAEIPPFFASVCRLLIAVLLVYVFNRNWY